MVFLKLLIYCFYVLFFFQKVKEKHQLQFKGQINGLILSEYNIQFIY